MTNRAKSHVSSDHLVQVTSWVPVISRTARQLIALESNPFQHWFLPRSGML